MNKKDPAELNNVLLGFDFKPDMIQNGIEEAFLPLMKKHAELLRSRITDDYEKLESQQVKAMVMEDYNRINHNIRVINHVAKYYKFMNIN